MKIDEKLFAATGTWDPVHPAAMVMGFVGVISLLLRKSFISLCPKPLVLLFIPSFPASQIFSTSICLLPHTPCTVHPFLIVGSSAHQLNAAISSKRTARYPLQAKEW
jgi:hypothetical protein